MKWEEFIKAFGTLPIIKSEMLSVGETDPRPLKVQISRWQKQGKLIQLKRGTYVLAEPYRKTTVYEPYLAATLKQPSYISMEKAFEFHNLIPERVNTYTCVTTKRPEQIETKLGIFNYQHVKIGLFWGYRNTTINRQTGFVALPEKALLDFFYLNEVKISFDYLMEMRLQNFENINLKRLIAFAKKFNKPGILKAAKIIKKYIEQEGKEKRL